MKKPANALIAELQNYSKLLADEPEKYGIGDLYALEERVWEHAEEIKVNFPRCKLSHLKSQVHTFDTFEAYNLIHRRDNILESIVIHRDIPKA